MNSLSAFTFTFAFPFPFLVVCSYSSLLISFPCFDTLYRNLNYEVDLITFLSDFQEKSSRKSREEPKRLDYQRLRKGTSMTIEKEG